MKSLLILSIFFLSCKTLQLPFKPVSQKPSTTVYPYIFKWVSVAYEPGVVSYKIQQSSDGRNWGTLNNGTVFPKHLPDSNVYNFTLPTPRTSKFYRVNSQMVKQKGVNQTYYLSKSIYVKPK